MQKARLVCHRGTSNIAPENTMASLEGAIRVGAYAVELDIQTSRDGVLYVLHDETVDRTTNGSGRIAEMTSDQIDELDAGSWFDSAFVGEKVPRLEHFLDACRNRIHVYAEIKQADPALVRDQLAARGLLENAWTFSFDQAIRAETRARVPDLRRMVLFDHVGSVARAVAADATILEFNEESLSAERVSDALSAGLLTQIFYAGSDPKVFEDALAFGVQQFNIDDYDLFNELVTKKFEAAS